MSDVFCHWHRLCLTTRMIPDPPSCCLYLSKVPPPCVSFSLISVLGRRVGVQIMTLTELGGRYLTDWFESPVVSIRPANL